MPAMILVGATLCGRPKEGTAQSPSRTEKQSFQFAATRKELYYETSIYLANYFYLVSGLLQ